MERINWLLSVSPVSRDLQHVDVLPNIMPEVGRPNWLHETVILADLATSLSNWRKKT